MEPGQTIYSLDPTTLQQVNSAQAEALILHNEDRFRMEISALKVAGFRVKIREAFPLVARFEVRINAINLEFCIKLKLS